MFILKRPYTQYIFTSSYNSINSIQTFQFRNQKPIKVQMNELQKPLRIIMISENLQTIKQREYQNNIPIAKDWKELSPDQKSRVSNYIQSQLYQMSYKELERLSRIINIRLGVLNRPKMRKASSKQYIELASNEISLFAEDKSHIEQQSLMQSPNSQLDEKFLTFESTELLRNKQQMLRGRATRDQNLPSGFASRRGSLMKVNTSTNKKIQMNRDMQLVSPSYKLDNFRTNKNSKVQKKTTLMSKFRIKFGVEAGERDINQIKEIQRELSLKTQNDSESLFPIVLGIIGLLAMLQIYMY